MLNAKSVLMIVMLASGLLTVLTGTAVSQVALADKDDGECKDNGNNSCNEETQKIYQENNCKIVNENKNEDNSDKNVNDSVNSGALTCSNFDQNPQGGTAIINLEHFIEDPFALIP